MSSDDPFAPREDPEDTPRAVKRAPKPVERVENDATGEVGLSVKFGSGFEAPMFHVKAADIYTLGALVGYEGPTDVSTRSYLAGLTSWWSTVSKSIRGGYDPTTDRGTTDTESRSNVRPLRRTQQDAEEADTQWMYDREVPPECRHGEWKPVTKEGAKGRWFAWGCPGGKGNSCSDGLKFVRK